MAETNQELPYRILGDRLRRMRESLSESIAEVAGSVEVDLHLIDDIEKGLERPSEDILLLLISHFNVKEDEANKIWELAGYDKLDNSESDTVPKNTIMVMPADARVLYTDMAHITGNKQGIILNFMQTNGASAPPLMVSRLGMSREYAQELIELLQRALGDSDTPPRLLSDGK